MAAQTSFLVLVLRPGYMNMSVGSESPGGLSLCSKDRKVLLEDSPQL